MRRYRPSRDFAWLLLVITSIWCATWRGVPWRLASAGDAVSYVAPCSPPFTRVPLPAPTRAASHGWTPRPVDVLMYRAAYDEDRHDYQRAIADRLAALRISDLGTMDDDLNRRPLSVDEELAGQEAAARAIWQALLAKTDTSQDIVLALVSSRRYADALRAEPFDARDGASIGLTRADVIVRAGLASARDGYLDRAARAFRAAIDCEGSLQLPHAALAVAAAALGDRTTARAESLATLERYSGMLSVDIHVLTTEDDIAMRILLDVEGARSRPRHRADGPGRI